MRQDSSPPPPLPPSSGLDLDEDDDDDTADVLDALVVVVVCCCNLLLLLLFTRLLLLSRLRGDPLGVVVTPPFFSVADRENSRRLVCGVRPGPGEWPAGPRLAGDGEAVWAPFRRVVAVPPRVPRAGPLVTVVGSGLLRRMGLSGVGGMSADSAVVWVAAVMTTVGGVVDVLDFILCLSPRA